MNSPAYVTIDGNDDGKVKVEFGDDPARTGTYSFSFHVNNLTDKSVSYSSAPVCLRRKQSRMKSPARSSSP